MSPPAPLPLTVDYAGAREDFLVRAAAAGARLESHVHPDLGPAGEELACDVAWLGPDDAAVVVVVVSGTHGVEGFAGSALQRTWLRDNSPARPAAVAVCLVHALNPFGFAWVRRTCESNVDLNRNFVDFADPPDNPGYDRLASALVPESWDAATQDRARAEILQVAVDEGPETLQQWVSGGQYHHPTGLFYGGSGPVWSHRLLDSLCDGPWAGRDRVVFLDLHTGLGPWGVGELISSDPPASDEYRRAVEWWGTEVTSLTAGDSVSAELVGEWLPYVAARLADTEVTGVAIEYGTVDTVAVIDALRADAWLHAHGDPSGPAAVGIKTALRAAFADDDPGWIAVLHPRFTGVLGSAFDALEHR